MMKTQKTTLTDRVLRAIETSDAAVGRAMVILLSRQTSEEQHQGATSATNGRGFAIHTAHRGTKCARWVLGLAPNASEYDTSRAIVAFLASTSPGRLLTGWHLQQAREIAFYHRRQLIEVAVVKQAQLAQTG